jgi:hypothetical protein
MKTGRIQSWMMMAALGLLVGVPAGAQSVRSVEQTHAMAATADSPTEHATAARQYRLHAEALDAKAEEHETKVKALTRAAGASIYKWPGMASGQLKNEKAKAMEARRNAREMMALADRHLRLAVEAQAVAAD